MKKIFSILIILITITLFAQPKPFDPAAYQDGQKNLSDQEREHYNEYKKKYVKLGLETKAKNPKLAHDSNYMLNLFYHYSIDIDKMDEYKKELDIDLKQISNGEFNEGGKNLLFSHAIVIATVVKGKNTTKQEGFNGEIIYQVNEVLKGEYHYEEFPEIIKCYYWDYYERLSVQGNQLSTIYNEILKPGDKCILFLNYRGKDATTELYEDYGKPNTYFEPYGFMLGSSSRLTKNFIEYAIDFAKKLEKINIKESTHPARE
jgi:hypothetical protein